VGAVVQTPIAFTLSDRSWPLVAAKCGPTVARRASHVRFLRTAPNSSNRCASAGAEAHQGEGPKPGVGAGVGIAPSQCTGPNPASRHLAPLSCQPTTAALIIATRQLAGRQPRNWFLASEKQRLPEVKAPMGATLFASGAHAGAANLEPALSPCPTLSERDDVNREPLVEESMRIATRRPSQDL
jgi:hypothetical protein